MDQRIPATALIAVVVAALAAAVLSCATNPVTGKSELMLLSEADELAMGKQTDPQILQSYGQYDDPALTAYVAAIGKKMGALSHRPEVGYSFKILDSDVVNAFAVPGGFVYLTRGIMGYLNDEAELAGVMAHEIGHVAARHSAQQYSKAQAAQLGLGLGSMVSETFAKYAGAASVGISMLFLSFSRDNEREADDLGVLYSSKAGYDANRMANLFVTLERLAPSEGSNGLPAWFSTHPNPPDRIVAIQKAARAWQQANPQVKVAVNRDQYLSRLEGLVFGEDPRQGYVDGSVFYHPQLRFQFPVPAGWTVSNTPSQVQIVSKQQDAAILLRVASQTSPAAAAEAFVTNNKATVVTSEAGRINGLAAQRVVCDIATEEGAARLLSSFVQKDNLVYLLLGYTAKAKFDGYRPTFEQTVSQFNSLTDPGRINVKPARLAVKKAPAQGTLRQNLQTLGVSQQAALDAHAILNGMKLDDAVSAGTLVKVVAK